MRATRFQDILFWAAYKLGLDPRVNLQPSQAEALTAYLNFHIKLAWERFPWPELCRIEQRFYRPSWLVGTAYPAGTEIWDATSAAYYLALSTNTGVSPGTHPAVWQVLGNNFNRYIGLDQPGATPIGTTLCATNEDPRLIPGTIPLATWFSNDGIQLPRDAGTSVWVQFRLRPSEFTALEYKAATAYPIGGKAYDPLTGECYLSLAANTGVTPSTDAAKWQLIEFPTVLGAYVRKAMESEALQEDGQDDKAAARMGQAERSLADEIDSVESQQGQERRFTVNVRSAPRQHIFTRSLP